MRQEKAGPKHGWVVLQEMKQCARQCVASAFKVDWNAKGETKRRARMGMMVGTRAVQKVEPRERRA